MHLPNLSLLLLLLASTVAADCNGGASTWISFITTSGNLTTPERQLSAWGGAVYIGSIKYSGKVEPLILTYPGVGGRPGGGEGGMVFTNYFSSMTGWRNPYVFPDRAAPLGFTSPHSAYVPQGADTRGFTVGREDRLLRYKNFNGWHACPTADYERSYRIYYVGEGVEAPAGCVKIDIPTRGYGVNDWTDEELEEDGEEEEGVYEARDL